MRKLKKIFARAVCLTVLCSLTACNAAGMEKRMEKDMNDAGNVTITAEEKRELENKLLDDWGKWLLTYESIYGDLLWAISYIEEFQETHCWDDLLLARMAINSAWKYIDHREMPEIEMTDEDYDYFYQQDKDIVFVQQEKNTFEADRNSALLSCKLLSQSVENNLFWGYELEDETKLTGLEKEECMYDLQIMAISTDYLLWTLDDSELTEQFNRFVAENCPEINALRTDGSQDGEQLTEAVNAILEERMENVQEMSAIIGKKTAAFDLYKEALMEDQVEELTRYAMIIKDAPLFLPYPDWFENADNGNIHYLWEDENGELRAPDEKEELSRKPDTCLMKFQGVTRQELEEYCGLLEQYGYPVTVDEETEDGYCAHYIIGDAQFTFEAKEDSVVCYMYGPDISVCFAPGWYILYVSR